MTAAEQQPTAASADTADPTATFEDFVAGRLALVTIRNQLQTQIAGLRSQLAIADSQLRQTVDLLRRAEEKIAAQYPEEMALLEGTATPERKR